MATGTAATSARRYHEDMVHYLSKPIAYTDTVVTLGVIPAADEMATTNDAYVTADTTIIATYAQTGTAATAGAGFAWVEYIMANRAL
jgi:hypothetical protein